MNAKRKAAWERTRRLGKRTFVMLLTLVWVVGYLVLYPVMKVTLFHEPFGMGMLVTGGVLGLLSGLIYGLLSWALNEGAYRNSTSRE